ncbi:NK-tumor recognition protein isoform X2 [Perognathus longimembris pacificus]|uniref:NK-tumor recognition protein isoform X2 n=1 Tax=Perognathus longimembris pacificus TaxID=214514 RepID=UPI0020187F9D|nr:NK-tumor recognition protein isoform X2 [Perognathus longimembris pacificus]
MGVQDRPQCHFDIEINREPVGRIMFQLFSDICPKTCKNFLCLCSGEKGRGKTTGKKLCYKGSTFHRVVKNFMIQGGDFSEGNGKGGESIYGGYFKDENFILKHDRAFLLSMANRGKHTNGSQFFITTKPAPHLDGVHVVFGLVISGFEVIEQIENLKTDAASRPYADVRVIDCGVLAAKSAKDVFEKKRKKAMHSEDWASSPSSSSSSESSSDSESERGRSRRRKRKRRPKVKHAKKRRKDASSSEELRNTHIMSPKGHSERSEANEKKSVESSAKREKPVVRPEEIPPVPENRFLLRRDMPVVVVEPEPNTSDVTPIVSDQKPSVSKSGRKIKGRGTIRYHTPPRSRSCSESEDDDSSETPPHWKEEMQRLRAYRPPSGEKWSKGDKLSDPCSSRWDERSLSQRSRSWSYNGYHSDLSAARHSEGPPKRRRKEKKGKHRKKAKKQKHCRRHKQARRRKAAPPVDAASPRASGRRARPPCGREGQSRSSSASSRPSSETAWSRSEREARGSSAGSSRDSYKSKSRCSGSDSPSRAASKSPSHRSHSRSRSSRSSASGPRRVTRAPGPPTEGLPAHAEPLRAAAAQVGSAAGPPAVAETLPVIPLSDSPPPSRWKPGQKPWKPSYERIQEMKARAGHLLPGPGACGLARCAAGSGSATSRRKRGRDSDSERSALSRYSGGRSSAGSRGSGSRTSRSRSSSRSYSRSRSRSPASSRSRSRSSASRSRRERSDDYSRSSSFTSASSHGGRRTPRTRGSGGKKRGRGGSRKALGRKPARGRGRRRRPRSESGSWSACCSSDSEQASAPPARGRGRPELRAARPRAARRAWKESPAGPPRAGARRKDYAESKWDAESDAEPEAGSPDKPDPRRLSEKEEGEASSDSEEAGGLPVGARRPTTSPRPGDRATQPGCGPVSASDSEGAPGPERGGGKAPRPGRGAQLNRKGKEKLRAKKDRAPRAPKRSQAFHWQPPLEFGDEEEEEAAVEKHDQPAPRGAKGTPEASGHGGPRDGAPPPEDAHDPGATAATQELAPCSPATPKPGGEQDAVRTDDNMEMCTPERSSPPAPSQPGTPESSRVLRQEAPAGPPDPEGTPPESGLGRPAGAKESPGKKEEAEKSKWKPVRGVGNVAAPLSAGEGRGAPPPPPPAEARPQGLRIEIKSKSKVRPGSLFDEVRKTARLNRRPRNRESSSEEPTPGRSHSHSHSRSASASRSRSPSEPSARRRTRTRSASYSRSRSRSPSRSSTSSYRSRSYSRSRSRGRYGRGRTRSRSSSYCSYKSHRTSSRSRSASSSSGAHSRSSYYSRSRSHSWSPSRSRSHRSSSYHRGRSYHRSRTRRSYGSDSRSDCSYSHRRSPSESSRYS